MNRNNPPSHGDRATKLGRTDHCRWAVLPCAILIVSAWLVSLAYAEQAKPFPSHWGEPPPIQTHDYVEWPDGYGHGSSTVAHWIKARMKEDASTRAPAQVLLYHADFDMVDPGELPEDFMVLNGEFAVRETNDVRFMELPGTPLDSYSVMFGPAGDVNMAVSAKVQASSKGRRHPAFAVGLNGLGGYRLKLVPARGVLELFTGPENGGETVAATPFNWDSGEWVHLRLQVRRGEDGEWHVDGSAWMDGQPEPSEWMVSHVETRKPLPGRPFVEASPYAGTPIRFDDLRVYSLDE